MKRLLATSVCLMALVVTAAAVEKPAAVFPLAFAGWQRSGAEEMSTQAARADRVYADLLQEFGFLDFHAATFVRPDRKLEVRAIRFRDASGAYGAFTFYKTPEMQTESIGDQGSSANERVLFYRGNLLVEAVLDRVTAMSAGEVRELGRELTVASGAAGNLPLLPTYLPKQGYIPNTAKYVLGPLGLSHLSTPVSAELVDFKLGAEVVTGQYRTGDGVASLTMIAYPTPQIAGDRLRAMEAAIPDADAGQRQGQRIASKRTGPIVAMVSGSGSVADAKSLLALVNFDADVTWSEAVPTGKDDPRSLMRALVVLTAIVLGIALVAGIAFGGFRLLVKHLYPDRVFDRTEDVEIIRLNLR
jgi:hypothetical protein